MQGTWFFCENYQQAFWASGADGFIVNAQLLFQDMSIEKHKDAEGLVPRGRGGMLIFLKVKGKGVHLCVTHFIRVALIVEENAALDPMQVYLPGSIGIMLQTLLFPDPIKRFDGWQDVPLVLGLVLLYSFDNRMEPPQLLCS